MGELPRRRYHAVDWREDFGVGDHTPSRASVPPVPIAPLMPAAGSPAIARTTRTFEEKDLHVLIDDPSGEEEDEDDDADAPWLADHQRGTAGRASRWCERPCDNQLRVECQCFHGTNSGIVSGRA